MRVHSHLLCSPLSAHVSPHPLQAGASVTGLPQGGQPPSFPETQLRLGWLFPPGGKDQSLMDERADQGGPTCSSLKPVLTPWLLGTHDMASSVRCAPWRPGTGRGVTGPHSSLWIDLLLLPCSVVSAFGGNPPILPPLVPPLNHRCPCAALMSVLHPGDAAATAPGSASHGPPGTPPLQGQPQAPLPHPPAVSAHLAPGCNVSPNPHLTPGHWVGPAEAGRRPSWQVGGKFKSGLESDFSTPGQPGDSSCQRLTVQRRRQLAFTRWWWHCARSGWISEKLEEFNMLSKFFAFFKRSMQCSADLLFKSVRNVGLLGGSF